MTALTAGRIMKKAADCLEDSKWTFDRKLFDVCAYRAYFSIYHSIQGLLFVSGVQAKDHSQAHSKFSEMFIKTGLMDISLHKRLKRTFEMRQASDYQYYKVSEQEALKSIENAAAFFESAIQYLKENNHLQ